MPLSFEEAKLELGRRLQKSDPPDRSALSGRAEENPAADPYEQDRAEIMAAALGLAEPSRVSDLIDVGRAVDEWARTGTPPKWGAIEARFDHRAGRSVARAWSRLDEEKGEAPGHVAKRAERWWKAGVLDVHKAGALEEMGIVPAEVGVVRGPNGTSLGQQLEAGEMTFSSLVAQLGKKDVPIMSEHSEYTVGDLARREDAIHAMRQAMEPYLARGFAPAARELVASVENPDSVYAVASNWAHFFLPETAVKYWDVGVTQARAADVLLDSGIGPQMVAARQAGSGLTLGQRFERGLVTVDEVIDLTAKREPVGKASLRVEYER
jgi:hypothetical protein